MNCFNINQKVIFVTGAFGLIGKAISKCFIAQGARVLLADIDARRMPSLEIELKNEFPHGLFVLKVLDITDSNSVAECVKAAIEIFGRIDVLINNAAIDAKFDKENGNGVNQSRFENYPLDLLRKSVEVNLIGTVLVTQQVCRQMLLQGSGNIINVASTYSLVAPNQSLYDFGDEIKKFKPIDYIATKSFIPNFTRYVATFYSQDNIRCNAIVPHGIYNDHDEKFVVNFSRLSPLGRMCDKTELNGPFTFLASEASSYMTGSVLVVDGGWTAW